VGGPPEPEDPTFVETGGVRTVRQSGRGELCPRAQPGQEHVRAPGNLGFYGPEGKHHPHRGLGNGQELSGTGAGTSGMYDGTKGHIRQYGQAPQKTKTMQSGRYLSQGAGQTLENGPVDPGRLWTAEF
tara:strand:- start:27957 stop:28340 length:384 start_codon:yes stop_codon:yes gene_type:complete